MTGSEEREILAAARSGDRAALERGFREIFERYRERVFAVCLRLTGNAHDAEDAVQECFVSVLRGLPGFRGEAGVYTWIYRIAVRAAHRLAVRRRRAPVTGVPAEPAVEPRPEVEQAEEVEGLLEELRSLPLGPRTILALCAIEGHDARRVADILGIPEGTVWSRLHRAREQLSERRERRASRRPRGVGRARGSGPDESPIGPPSGARGSREEG